MGSRILPRSVVSALAWLATLWAALLSAGCGARSAALPSHSDVTGGSGGGDPGAEAVPSDGSDEVRDGRAGRADSDCADASTCRHQPEDCGNALDDDQDGRVDCADSDCGSDPTCASTCVVGSCCYAATTRISVGERIDGDLTESDESDGPRGDDFYFDDIEFSGTAGDHVVIETIDGGFDTYLYLLDENCSPLTHDDDGGASLLSRVDYTLPVTGVYTVVVTSYSSGTTGWYVLAMGDGIVSGYESNCQNGRDDDWDGLYDCDDPDCYFSDSCATPFETDCTNGRDDDQDGRYDCEDPDCHGYPECAAQRESDCGDGRDEDSDGLWDCEDPDCAGARECRADHEVDCRNGADEDFDGLYDCEDVDCAEAPECDVSCEVGWCCYTDTATTQVSNPFYAGALTTSDPSTGPRGLGYYFDDIELHGSAGMRLVVETVEADFDTYLYLLDDECTAIGSDNDGGSGLLSRIEFTLPQSGVYTIVVTSFSAGSTGDYLLATALVQSG